MDGCPKLHWILCEWGMNFDHVMLLNFWACLLPSITKPFLTGTGGFWFLESCVYRLLVVVWFGPLLNPPISWTMYKKHIKIVTTTIKIMMYWMLTRYKHGIGSAYINSCNSQSSPAVGSIIILILQMWNSKLREVKRLSHGHTACKWQARIQA